MKIISLTIITILLLTNCKPKETEGQLIEPTTSINVDLHIEDTLYIEAGDLFNDLSIVRLETNSTLTIGNIYGLIRSNNYFIIETDIGCYLFTHNGRFLRELYRRGRGPEEFLSPKFSPIIVNNILYLEDWSKSRDRYYGIDIESGEIKVIEKPLAWHTHDFLVTEEETIAAFGEYIPDETDHATGLSRVFKRDIYFQDMNGNLVGKCDLGFAEHGRVFGLAEMHNLGGEIYLTTPRGETTLRIRDNQADTIWTNHFDIEFKRGDIPGKYTYASLIYYSTEWVLLQKQEVEIVIRQNIRSGRQARKGIILVDRYERTTKILKSYLKTRSNPLYLTKFDFTRDGYLCKVLYAHQIVEMIKDPDMENYINELMQTGSYFADEQISIDNNPFLLIGRIND